MTSSNFYDEKFKYCSCTFEQCEPTNITTFENDIL